MHRCSLDRTISRRRVPSAAHANASARQRLLLGLLAVAVGVGLVLATTGALAAGSDSAKSSESDDPLPPSYEKGMKLVSEGELEKAREAFAQANRKRRNDPDILNMLAYTQRKTGDLDQAIGNYHKALRLRPDFPDAHEYLGEAYLQAALEQLKALADGGEKSAKQHGQLLRALHDGTRGLIPPPRSARW